MTDTELLARIRAYGECLAQQTEYRSSSGHVEDAHAAHGLATTYYYEIRDELRRRSES